MNYQSNKNHKIRRQVQEQVDISLAGQILPILKLSLHFRMFDSEFDGEVSFIRGLIEDQLSNEVFVEKNI